MLDVVFSRKSDEWSTPPDLFRRLDDLIHFTLDPCCTQFSRLCKRFFTIDDDGLLQDWSGEVVFCNPPYSQISRWVSKTLSSDCKAVLLLPSRTDTKWFHSLLNDDRCRIEFIKGRLKFGNSKNNAPFPSILVYYNF